MPYVDLPLDHWRHVRDLFGDAIREVYLPLAPDVLGSGRPPQPSRHLDAFLDSQLLPVSVVANPITLPGPVDAVAPRVIAAIRRLLCRCEVASVTVADPLLAGRLRSALPDLPLVASVLMDIADPGQLAILPGVFDVLVPSARVMRNLPALGRLRAAFAGRLRLLVNEGCLPGCPHRKQHFQEMAWGSELPRSLCNDALAERPWLRLTGAWVLPQHLHFFEGLFDEAKLAGRVTLQDPARFLEVVGAYVHRRRLGPDRIGCGPAGPTAPLEVSDELYAHTLACDRACLSCDVCRLAYAAPRGA